jgi:anaerobic selenocysteine-containing dehydrogenase
VIQKPEHHVHTACPLDCPDSCSLVVTVREGRVVALDGGDRNPATQGYICGKVRKFDHRMYGQDRIASPGVRVGPKGSGQFRWVDWDEALDRVAGAMRKAKDEFGGESVLPFYYGGSNGFLTQDSADARLFRRFGASRLARTVCAAAAGAAAQGLYGKMPSVTFQDYVHAQLIVIWGFNPSASGIHIVPFIREAQKAGAKVVVVDPRSTPLARTADLHIPLRPGTDLPVALALHRFLFETGRADRAFLDTHTTGQERLRERAAPWTFARAAETAGISADSLERLASMYAETTPAVIRCGWGPERNRNGGSAIAAILALPAVAGKFGVRGGGYSLSNSGSWGIEKTWIGEPECPTRLVNMNHLGRVLTEPPSPPVKVLFVYNCNPAATMPDQQRVLKGLQREDLTTVVFDQVMTDTARYADVVLPATTFLEHYDFARAYGPISLQIVQPAVDAVGQSKPNIHVFSELEARLGLAQDGDPTDELEMLLAVMAGLPPAVSDALRADITAAPPFGLTPVQFSDVFPGTADRRVHLCPDAMDAEAAAGLYAYQPDPATLDFPLALISPSHERTISSSLGELVSTPAALIMHPDDARARGLSDSEPIRVFNALGEVHCRVEVLPTVPPGTVQLSKGLWARHTANGATANSLAPDSLTDVGAGACFNDARVQVEKRHVEPVNAAARRLH